MELLKLRRRRQVALRGHKRLKDKLDELMKEFLARIGASRRLRAEVERELLTAYGLLALARGEMGWASLTTSLAGGSPADILEVSERSVMAVRIPAFQVVDLPAPGGYSLLTAPLVLDSALEAFAAVAPRLIELAAREKAVELLAAEIERTRRRVNALEHVLIPQLDEAIRGISMKLEEIERSALTRVMKVKAIIEAHGAR
jgi:V/A-type H+-transporting ATPase subunit D